MGSGKAWDIVGWTDGGGAYCTAHAQEGSPVFASDEHDMTCEKCGNNLGKDFSPKL